MPSASPRPARRSTRRFFAELKKHFTEPQIVELTAAIAMENFRSKFNPPLGIEAQGFCMVPPKR